MRISLMLWLVLAIQTTFFAQNQPTNIQPKELIQSKQHIFNNLNNTSLFELNTARNTELNLSNYQILELKEEASSALAHQAPQELQLSLPNTDRNDITLQLSRIDYPALTVIESASQTPTTVDAGIHYRGIIAGDEQSIATLSLIDGELMGLISSDRIGGNLVLAKMDSEDRNHDQQLYALYQDKEVFENNTFSCATADAGTVYERDQLSEIAATSRDLSDCVQVYFEVNYDIYQDKGSVQASVQYVTALFNQTATLYANEQINMSISEIFVWNTPSPFNATSSGQMLTDFQAYRTDFNGDLAQLLSYKASGGIAVVDGLCHPYNLAKMSYAGISGSFQAVPTYSWSVMVMTHELGHLLGSQHTHACVWNGNGTAIDACPGYTEGGCGSPAPPSNGGTIMSYCHLSQVGINLSQGFDTQPGNLIRNKVAAAACLTACTNGGDNGNGNGNGNEEANCEQEQVFFRLKLDTYSPETSWTLKDANGVIVEQGGPYPKTLANQWVIDTFCLPQACYTFEIKDAYNDGICCTYGEGSYSLTDAQLNILTQGNAFTNMEQSNFCLPYDPSTGNEDCQAIDFSQENIISYGANQDQGQFAVQDDGATLYIANNAWKAIMMDYEITPNTKISFDFKSTREGEIHGIGFDNNEFISYGYTFRVFGTQNWGLGNFDNYPANNDWKSYTIPVGEYYVGPVDRLFFSADHDGGTRNGNAFFKNVRIYEGDDCMGSELINNDTALLSTQSDQLKVFPNPVSHNSQIELQVNQTSRGNGLWEIISLNGQVLKQGHVTTDGFAYQENIELSGLAAGTYLLRWQDENGTQSKRFHVQ